VRADLRLDVDFLVIGGGPSGSACANNLARNGAKVALVEATDFTRFRSGELIDASALPLLTRLGVSLDRETKWAAPCSGIASQWGHESVSRQSSIFNPYGHSWRVDRSAFDRALFDRAIEVGVAGFLSSRVSQLKRERNAWCFTLESAEHHGEGRAQSVVVATGRSRRASLLSSKPRYWIDRLIGIALVGDPQRATLTAADKFLHVQTCKDGWWYSVTTPLGKNVSVYLTDNDLLPQGKSELQNFLHGELSHINLTERARVAAENDLFNHRWLGFDARTSVCGTAASNGWTAIGDALAAFDPLFGRGIFNALSSATRAAHWLLYSPAADLETIPEWTEHTVRSFNEFIELRRFFYGLENRWKGSLFWARRHESLDHV
jgi:flavin-dependent dehydrogenase